MFTIMHRLIKMFLAFLAAFPETVRVFMRASDDLRKGMTTLIWAFTGQTKPIPAHDHSGVPLP